MSSRNYNPSRESSWVLYFELYPSFSKQNITSSHRRSKVVTDTDANIESAVRQMAARLEVEAQKGWISDSPVIYGDAELITCDVYDDASKSRLKKATVFAWRNVWSEETGEKR